MCMRIREYFKTRGINIELLKVTLNTMFKDFLKSRL